MPAPLIARLVGILGLALPAVLISPAAVTTARAAAPMCSEIFSGNQNWGYVSLRDVSNVVAEAEALLALDMNSATAQDAASRLRTAADWLSQFVAPKITERICSLCDSGDPQSPDTASGLFARVWAATVFSEALLQVGNTEAAGILLDARNIIQPLLARFETTLGKKWCGDVSAGADTAAIEELNRSWSWQVPGNNFKQSGVTLRSKKGKFGFTVANSPHPNETYWWLLGKKLVMVRNDGVPSGILLKESADKWSGRSLMAPLYLFLVGETKPTPPPAPPPPTPAASECFDGYLHHTAGPNKGKRYAATMCIQWDTEPCAFVSQKITSQKVTLCTLGKRIRGQATYTNTKTITWDLEISPETGDLSGRWNQSDGAKGVWEPEQ